MRNCASLSLLSQRSILRKSISEKSSLLFFVLSYRKVLPIKGWLQCISEMHLSEAGRNQITAVLHTMCSMCDGRYVYQEVLFREFPFFFGEVPLF